MVLELLVSDAGAASAEHTHESELLFWADKLKVPRGRLPARASVARRRLAPGLRGQPRCLHPVHALHPRLPRHPGQRRARPGAARRAREDRVRPGRRGRRLELRGLRRMRAGLPDRRADAGARRGPGEDRARGRIGLPVLRRRLPAHAARRPRRSRARRRSTSSPAATARPTTAGCASRAASASTTCTTTRRLTTPLVRRDGVAKDPADIERFKRGELPLASLFREASWDEALDLAAGGLGAHPRHHAGAAARAAWPASARPRAATRRPTCSRSWCAPGCARTTSTTARGCAMRVRSRRCSRGWARARCPTRWKTWRRPTSSC